MVDIKIYTIKELKEWVANAAHNGISTDVISKSRAYAIVHNPYATEEMPALAVASLDGNVVGYTAVFADKYNGKIIYWGTTGYISPEVRGKGIGTQLYATMMTATNNKWFASESSKSALAISYKTGLNVTFFDRYYLRYYSANNIRSKIKSFLVKKKNAIVLRRTANSLTLDVTKNIDSETFSFISSHQQNALFPRECCMFNWILQFPFMMEAPSILDTYSQYQFTTAIDHYTIYAVRFLCNSVLVAVAIFRLKDDELTLLYLFYEKEHKADIYNAIITHILQQKLSVFRTFELELIGQYNQLGAISMNSRSRVEKVSLSTPTWFECPKYGNLQCGDGDMFA